MPPWDHSDRFEDEGPSIEPKADTERKEPVVDGKQESVRGSPKCYNSSAQLVQLNQPPNHREEAGTGVSSSSMPQYQGLLIDPTHWFLPLHTKLALCEIIVARFSGQKYAIHHECGTEDGIEDSDEEGFQNGDGIEPSSKAVLMVLQKEESKLKAIQRTEEVLIDADGGSKE